MIDAGVLLQQVSAALTRPRHATYRLQLGAALGFDAVADLAPYLAALGVERRLPLAVLQVRAGQHARLRRHRPQRASIRRSAAPGRFDRMAAALAARGLGLHPRRRPESHGHRGRLQPVVARRPGERPQLAARRVLRHRLASASSASSATRCCCPSCPTSTAASSRRRQLVRRAVRGRVLRALRRRRACRSSPDTYPQILGASPRRARRAPRRRAHAGCGELRSILTALDHLPGRTETDPARDRGAPAREGDRQAPARRPRQGVAGDPRARRGQRPRR